MQIILHQPIKSAWQLNLPWRTIVLVAKMTFWWWLKIRAHEIKHDCGTIQMWKFFAQLRFPTSGKGTFGYFSRYGGRWQKVASLQFSVEEIFQKLKAPVTIYDCDYRTIVLVCGCRERRALTTQISSWNVSDDVPCESCGKFHYPAGQASEYLNCEQHAKG